MSLETPQALLDAVTQVLEHNQKNRQERGADFNIFSILGLESDEVRLHSAFLGRLLDPNGEHGRKDEPLKAFLRLVSSKLEFNPKTTKVYCELFAGDLGRIDIAIIDDKNLLVVENKIYASEQTNQLGRYDEYAKKSGKNYEIYYLTLFGDESRENGDLADYKKMSYAKEILYWFENLALPQVVSAVVLQYCSIIRKLTNQNDRGVEVEIEKLLTTKEAIISADAIAKALGGVKAEIEMKFWKELYESIKEPFANCGFIMSDGHPWNFDGADKNYIQDERAKSGGFVQLIFERKISHDLALEFYMESATGKALNYAIVPVDDSAERKKDSFVADIAKEIGLNRISGYAFWEYHSQSVNIGGEGLYDLVDDPSRFQIVQSVADEAALYVKKLSASLKS